VAGTRLCRVLRSRIEAGCSQPSCECANWLGKMSATPSRISSHFMITTFADHPSRPFVPLLEFVSALGCIDRLKSQSKADNVINALSFALP
jgi:hypothetical protein